MEWKDHKATKCVFDTEDKKAIYRVIGMLEYIRMQRNCMEADGFTTFLQMGGLPTIYSVDTLNKIIEVLKDMMENTTIELLERNKNA